MTNISSDLIRELRKRTSIGVTKCKQALIKANGNIELAIDYMRKSGLDTAVRKSGRSTPAGLIAVEITANRKCGIMIEINCETDFVAKSSIFQKFAKTVIITALNESINDINTLKTRFEVQRVNLVDQLAENINIRRFVILQGNFLGFYVHGVKIGVIVSASGNVTVDLIKCIAMHIAARNPKYINIDDISEDIMIRERHIQMDIAMRSDVSHNISERIIEGRMNKFMSEIVLAQQDFVMDTNKTVGEFLVEHGITINNFVRFEMGDDV